MAKKLFEDFPSVTAEEWEKIILKDIKQQDISFLDKHCDDIDIKCFYTNKDIKNLDHIAFFEQQSNLQQAQTDINICQLVRNESPKLANERTKENLGAGLNAAAFSITGTKTDNMANHMSEILNDIDMEKVFCYYEAELNSPLVFHYMLKEAEKQKIPLSQIRGAIDNDPLLFLMTRGELADEKDFSRVKYILEKSDEIPCFYGMTIRGDFFHEKGASIVQEIAYTIAAAVEYTDQLSNLGLSCDQIVRNIQFSFGVSTNYFLEIAKLQAAKLVWANICSQLSLTNQYPISIHSHTSLWNKSSEDKHTNIIRTTIEAMAAILGGSSSLSIGCFEDKSKMAQRIAKNIYLILKEEAFFKSTHNPINGSYYIEKMTQEIASKSWALFQEIEKQGGFIASLKNNYIQNQIANSRNQKLKYLQDKKNILVGVNKYQLPNTQETNYTSTSKETKTEMNDAINKSVAQYEDFSKLLSSVNSCEVSIFLNSERSQKINHMQNYSCALWKESQN